MSTERIDARGRWTRPHARAGWVLVEPSEAFLAERDAPRPEPVPASVPLWRLMVVLEVEGIKPALLAAVDALPEPNRAIAAAFLANGTDVERGHALVALLQGALALSDAQADDLFRAANALPV